MTCQAGRSSRSRSAASSWHAHRPMRAGGARATRAHGGALGGRRRHALAGRVARAVARRRLDPGAPRAELPGKHRAQVGERAPLWQRRGRCSPRSGRRTPATASRARRSARARCRRHRGARAPVCGDQPLDQFAHQQRRNPRPSCRRCRSTPGASWPRPRTSTRPRPCGGWRSPDRDRDPPAARSARTGESLRLRHRHAAPAPRTPPPGTPAMPPASRLGVEVEAHDARRQIGDRDHLLDRRARRPIDMQRGDAGVDQALALADAARPAGPARRRSSQRALRVTRATGSLPALQAHGDVTGKLYTWQVYRAQ